MAMVAAGSADLYVEFGIHAWDIAAGALIVKEAGGVCIDPAGNRTLSVVYSYSSTVNEIGLC